MPLEAYPDSVIPIPLVDFNAEVNPMVIRTQMESGRPRQRIIDVNEIETVNVTFSFDATEYPIFRAWHNTTITRGADFFTMDMRIEGTVKNYEVRFVEGRYSTDRAGAGNWNVHAAIEIIDRNLDSYP